MTASNTPDQRIDEILLDAINEGWFLRSKQEYPDGFTGADVKKIQGKAKAALKSLFETMMAEVVGEDVVPANERSVNWTDNNLKADQRQRIPQVLNRYFGGGE